MMVQSAIKIILDHLVRLLKTVRHKSSNTILISCNIIIIIMYLSDGIIVGRYFIKRVPCTLYNQNIKLLTEISNYLTN